MTNARLKDADGARLCAWCGGEIRQSGVGRMRDYCSRTHREYAYRARRERRLIEEAVATISSTDEAPSGPDTSVDETRAPRPLLPPPPPEMLAAAAEAQRPAWLPSPRAVRAARQEELPVDPE